ncbi:MAG: hypothetical protein H7257_08340 [Taibaiella sp.]|nr:hypothetical protein [Taibaiella sp.]
MTNRTILSSAIVAAVSLASCSRQAKAPATVTPLAATATQPVKATAEAFISGATMLSAPVAEAKMYKLLPGYNSSDNFEASGVYYIGGYFYIACDNMQKIAKIKSTLPINSSQNSLLSTGAPGSGSSNYEGIAYDNNGTPNFFVVEESVNNGSYYQPRISELNSSMSYQNRMWVDYYFTSSTSNKAFEGIAWVYRGGNDYMLGLVEGTGKVPVFVKTGSNWSYVTEITLPSSVTFTDYSDIAIYGNQIAITSQVDGQLWIGTLSSTAWSITGGTAYTLPLGSSGGVIGAGSYQLYGNIEGVSFISSTQVVIVSDKADSGQPSYQSYKDQSVAIFNIP